MSMHCEWNVKKGNALDDFIEGVIRKSTLICRIASQPTTDIKERLIWLSRKLADHPELYPLKI